MPKRKDLTKHTRQRLYSVAHTLTSAAKEEAGLRIPFDVYIQDPFVADNDHKCGFDSKFLVRWEPGISDGPTSARFAVVDYNNDTGVLEEPARWNEVSDCFVDAEEFCLDRNNLENPQFDQMHVWAVLQRALEFFEDGTGLGRPIPYGFDGNRLIVVPHAGYGKNAFYDRESKSLQFYFFDNDNDERVYTCLSTDIINHEFGHAMLDGVRPHYYESVMVETAAFHEFVGDLSAILLLLRNNTFRKKIAEETEGDLTKARQLRHIAEQFGQAIEGVPYLRNAANQETMADVNDADGPHKFSEVMTGTMYEILLDVADHYVKDRRRSAKQAFWDAALRMKRMAIQPLDLLPPVDVTFRDYAYAVLRAEELSNPTDPHEYIQLMLKVFLKRGLLTKSDVRAFNQPRYVFERLHIKIKHCIDDLSRSRAAAYRFLNDNRKELLIPDGQDIVIADLYDTKKVTRKFLPLPRQIVLLYLWHEEVELKGSRFGEFDGERTTMLCGGTLVFDEIGNVLSWFRKPGTEGTSANESWEKEKRDGRKRRKQFLDDLEMQIDAGRIGAAIGSEKGMLGSQIPPLSVQRVEGLLRFGLSPHMHLQGEDHEHYEGGSTWEVSS